MWETNAVEKTKLITSHKDCFGNCLLNMVINKLSPPNGMYSKRTKYAELWKRMEQCMKKYSSSNIKAFSERSELLYDVICCYRFWICKILMSSHVRRVFSSFQNWLSIR